MTGRVLFTSDLLLALLALFLPPIPVWIKCGFWTWQLLLDVFLMLFGGVPATIYAWYIIIKHPDDGIPFFDTRRGTYEIIPDAENQVGDENGAGAVAVAGNGTAEQSSASQQPTQSGPYNGWNRPGDYQDSHIDGDASGSKPPPYDPSQAPAEIPGANNKIQFHDESLSR